MLIGCPVYQRAWILPQWYEAVVVASRVAGTRPEFIFVVEAEDDETIACIQHLIPDAHIVPVGQTVPQNDHQWNEARLHEMVYLRNILLEEVRKLNPLIFFSLDSDILIHSDTILNLMEHLDTYDAVGGKCYMSNRGTAYPSYAMTGQGGTLHRPNSDGVFKVDSIMAIKMMLSPAYKIDYSFHIYGEDIAWSKSARESGLTLGWDGRVCSKHVMVKPQLDVVDERCGF